MPWPAHTRSTTERQYGPRHQRLRKHYARIIAKGDGICWRCQGAIPPDMPWHLGHDDWDRTRYRGPEHVHCNLTAAARKGNLLSRRAIGTQSRRW